MIARVLTALFLVTAFGCGDDDSTDSTDDDSGLDGGPFDAGAADAAPPDDGGPPDAFRNATPVATGRTVDAQIDTPFDGSLDGSDPDGDLITFSIVNDPAHGTVELGPEPGEFTYTPDADYVGPDELTFAVSDGLASSEPATVTISVHYLTNGTLDTTFATGGWTAGAVPNGSLSDVLRLDGGRLVGAGSTNGNDQLLVGYGSDGAVDSDFGSGGTVVADLANTDTYQAIGRQSSGRLVSAGDHINGTVRDMLLAAHSSAGVLDTAFGTGGYVVVDHDGERDRGYALLVLDDDSILIGGHAQGSVTDATEDLAVARYDADGVLDTDFGTDGWTLIDVDGFDGRVLDMALDSTGRIVVAGYEQLGEGGLEEMVVARLDTDGAVDTSFGTDGATVVDLPGYSEARAVAIDERDRIWVAGSYTDDETAMVLVALDDDGTLDTAFDDDGWVGITGSGLRSSAASDLLIRPGGGFLMVGTAQTTTSEVVGAIVALLPNGALDSRYDSDGVSTHSFGTRDGFSSALRQPDGRVVVVGQSWTDEPRPLIARFAR